MPPVRPAPRFDRYLPLRSFRGGMGVVELCADLVEKKPVALKTFLPELLADVRARELFLREASVWMQIGAHPHVVEAFMVRRAEDQVYVVCELVAPYEGVPDASLRRWLGRPLAPGRALDFALGIARGMRWATSRVPGLVHRDLKPENVLVGRDGRAKVTDFGLAVLSAVQNGGFAGTPQYMAPEQWSGRAELRSDVYAFGLILLEMLTGSTNVRGSDLGSFASAHMGGAAALHAQTTALPEPLATLLRSAVAVDVAQRPASWEAVEAALAAAWPIVVGGTPPPLPEPAAITRERQILEGWSHNALANALVDLGHLGDAANGYRGVLEKARALGDPSLEAAAHGNLGNALVAAGDLQGALASLEASLAIKQQLGDRLGEARSLTNRGNARARMGQPAEALADYERAAWIFAEHGERHEHAKAQVNQIPMLARLSRAAEAKALAERCSRELRELGDRRGEGVVLGTLGQLHRGAGELDQALDCSRRALEAFRSVGDRLGEGRELSFQGFTLRALGKIPDALDCFGASQKLADECGDDLLLGSVCFALAELTPPLPQFASLGRRNAEAAAAAYRRAGREDLAADADRLRAKFQG